MQYGGGLTSKLCKISESSIKTNGKKPSQWLYNPKILVFWLLRPTGLHTIYLDTVEIEGGGREERRKKGREEKSKRGREEVRERGEGGRKRSKRKQYIPKDTKSPT